MLSFEALDWYIRKNMNHIGLYYNAHNRPNHIADSDISYRSNAIALRVFVKNDDATLTSNSDFLLHVKYNEMNKLKNEMV
jgi:hypothetical protein